MSTSVRDSEAEDALPDLCPGDHLPHWNHEPEVRVRHGGISEAAVSVELVSGYCPRCNALLLNIELELTIDGCTVRYEACWISVNDIARGTREFVLWWLRQAGGAGIASRGGGDERAGNPKP